MTPLLSKKNNKINPKPPNISLDAVEVVLVIQIMSLFYLSQSYITIVQNAMNRCCVIRGASDREDIKPRS